VVAVVVVAASKANNQEQWALRPFFMFSNI
jgi:hypothetical protein